MDKNMLTACSLALLLTSWPLNRSGFESTLAGLKKYAAAFY